MLLAMKTCMLLAALVWGVLLSTKASVLAADTCVVLPIQACVVLYILACVLLTCHHVRVGLAGHPIRVICHHGFGFGSFRRRWVVLGRLVHCCDDGRMTVVNGLLLRP